jgi:hypothetical protein
MIRNTLFTAKVFKKDRIQVIQLIANMEEEHVE